MQSLTVNIFFRKRQPQNHSIEELFLSLIPFISKEAKVVITQLPNAGASPLTMFKNLKFAHSKEEETNHITGDIHYLALAFKSNVILTIHDVKSALKGNFLKQFYIRMFWFWLPALFVKRITVISEFTKTELQCVIPFAKDKIRVIHNPINKNLKLTTYKFNDKNPQILFVGTKANKNLERSLEAIKDLTCTAVIIGKLTIAQEKLLKSYQIVYHNRFSLTFDEIVDCYKACDLVCFASTYEGFGMPIIEGQAMGKPVITSNFGAMKEVSNNSACEVNPNNVESIKQGIMKVCNNEIFRTQLIKDGLENVKRFQPEYIAKQYVELYKEMMA